MTQAPLRRLIVTFEPDGVRAHVLNRWKGAV